MDVGDHVACSSVGLFTRWLDRVLRVFVAKLTLVPQLKRVGEGDARQPGPVPGGERERVERERGWGRNRKRCSSGDCMFDMHWYAENKRVRGQS